ncbi:GNAT family N-acetyltransferase [Tessaracoccus sp. SD287]|uniref:GNAT family N-acetyltransferase n=1 Tax=Tessaracoccus sp. SD287 TaxID=2782008 RepID=UPI001A964219|nr:GNAT family N-acetyltransferase [Tessaracoccus sp. SD287]MBO1031728.1 GNAT family N-acetyltransferase [Tessaracoccus sp. SD287]
MARTEARVRPASKADLDTLRSFPHAEEVDVFFQAATLQEAIVAVVEVDGTVVGSAVLDLISELRPEVKRIWVMTDARRQKLGSTLTRWLEDQARELGYEATHMAIDPNNEKAIPMAVDLGYSATGDHLFVDQPDTIQVEDPEAASEHFAIFRKSLTMR